MPISSHDLKPFLNHTFLETGSYGLGSGITAALTAGFKAIYSVDINPSCFHECTQRFKHNHKVHLYLNDCSLWLKEILPTISVPTTIYLDANGDLNETVHPLYPSLEAIRDYKAPELQPVPLKHTLLLDDMNTNHLTREEIEYELFSNPNPPQKKIMTLLKEINKDYKFTLIDTHSEDMKETYPCWVLAAY